MKAFVTGSRAYGTPRQDSDLDLVVLPDDGEDFVGTLFKAGACDQGSRDDPPGFSLTLGNVNFIVVANKEQFAAWKKGTEALIDIAPVSRTTAITMLEAAGVE